MAKLKFGVAQRDITPRHMVTLVGPTLQVVRVRPCC